MRRAAASLALPSWSCGPGAVEDGPHSALIDAIEQGNLERVRSLLEARPALAAARDASGRSMFVLAHRLRRLEIAAEIQRHGLEPDLVEAVLARDAETFIQLAQADPDGVNADHPFGGPSYYAAAWSGATEMFWPLNRWGGNPNARGRDGISAFRVALDHPDRAQAREMAYRILVDAGDPGAEQAGGNTLLHGAAALGDAELVRDLIRRGATVDASDADGRTPLDIADREGHPDVAAVLRGHRRIPRSGTTSRLRLDARGEAYAAPGASGVPQFAINRFAEVCHYDLEAAQAVHREHPAVIHGNASWNELGVEACAHMERIDWTRHFLEAGAPLSLATAIAVRETKLARRLLEEDASRVHERGAHDFPLMWFPQIAGGHVESAELLLSYGADVNQAKQRVTGLHKAAYAGQTDLVAFLLERGADPSLIGRSDFSDLVGTPLDWARARDREDVVRLLEQRGSAG